MVAAADIDGNGAFDDRVTIESPPGTILKNVRAVSVPKDPPPPAGVFFLAGLFDYEVVVTSQAIRRRHVPSPGRHGQQGARYRVLGPPEWALVGPDARADADHVTDEVTVTLVDGGAGDEDHRADGVIEDPAGQVPQGPLDVHGHRQRECRSRR